MVAVGRPSATSRAKFGPESTAVGLAGRSPASTSLSRWPLAVSKPLAQITSGAAVGGKRPRDLPQSLHRHCQQQRIAGGRLGEIGACSDPGIELDLGEMAGIAMVALDRRRDLGVAREQQGAAPGAAHGLGERRAPGAGTDDADGLDHGGADWQAPERAVTCQSGPASTRPLILAAMMKSFSCRPLILCV